MREKGRKNSTYVVIYDIFNFEEEYQGAWISSDYRRRCRIAKELLKYGVRIQRSVFEIEISKTQIPKLKATIQKYCSKRDKIFIYLLEDKVKSRVKEKGTPFTPRDIQIL